MYHSITDDPERGVSPYYKVCTSPRRFAEHMRWLADNGYRGVTLREGLDWLRNDCHQTIADQEPRTTDDRPLIVNLRPPVSDLRPSQPVAITFDDGFRDFYTAAVPVLQQHGFSATMFLATSFLKDRRDLISRLQSLSCDLPRGTFMNRECLTWPEVTELHRTGIEFGSHTVSHPVLYELSWPDIEFEIRSSKAEIENRIGMPVPTFAYPFAFPQARREFRRRFCDALEATGYECCVTTRVGRARSKDDLFALARLPLNSDDDAALLGAKMTGAYDWLTRPQAVIKKIKLAICPKANRAERSSVRLRPKAR